ncbi:MAG TPA: RsmE family RNA methyltransferase [Candidatus Brocadiales bacterium]|nr:RsmE family RNA methyltransferase [Candidatus Brocadiales bacterium]
MTHRFYVPVNLHSKEVLVSGDETHHMLHVMRLGIGDCVRLFNGMGDECTGRIAETINGRVRVEIESVKSIGREIPVNITIAFSVPKGKRSDFLIQKCAELGVERLIPLQSERGVVKLYGEGKITKWRKVAIEAAKQCGRNIVTKITDTLTFDKLLETVGSYGLALVACPSPDVLFLREVLKGHPEVKDVLCLIRLEGGFSDVETEKAKNAGCVPVGLGTQTLRVETAAITISAMLMYAYAK